MQLSVVIPVYNEVSTVEELVHRVQGVPIDKQIVLVDDASADGTWDKLAALEADDSVVVLRHERNRGKGAALRTGFAAATGDIVLVVTEGARGHRDASPAHGLARVSSAALPDVRYPTSDTTRGARRAWPRTPPATGPARSGSHAAYGGSTTSHHAIGSGRCEARGWRSAYFSQPILEGDRSLFSPVPSPLVPRQRAQSANSLEKWRARQDSNLRPSASKADALSN